MTRPYARPQTRLLPDPTRESEPFWTGGRAGELLISRCRTCAHFFHPPAPACWRCRSIDVAPEAVSGTGVVAAYTVNRQQWIPDFEPPYVVAMIELDDEPDVRLISNVVDIDPAQVHVGMRVEAFFEQWSVADGADIWLPLFRPVSSEVER